MADGKKSTKDYMPYGKPDAQGARTKSSADRLEDARFKNIGERTKSDAAARKTAGENANASQKMKERLAGSKSVSKADYDRLSKSSTTKGSFKVRTPEQITADADMKKTAKKKALSERINKFRNSPKIPMRGAGVGLWGMMENR